MDPNRKDNSSNRLQLNFGYNNDRQYPSSNDRVYPTTPSTFPQPIYQQQGAQDYHNPQLSPQPYGQGYFMQNQYPQQQQQQQQQAQYASQPYQQQQQHLASPQPAYGARNGYTAGNAGTNDATNGLVQQLANQDLGAGTPRTQFFNRTPSPANSRPRTAGSPGQPPAGASHLAPPMPGRPAKTEEEELQKNPDLYSENVHKRGRAAKELVNVFFTENIERARDRNFRYVP